MTGSARNRGLGVRRVVTVNLMAHERFCSKRSQAERSFLNPVIQHS